MGNFANFAMTDSGRILFSSVQAGAVLIPTKIVIGSGSIPAGKTPATMTAVVTPVKELTINKRLRTPDGKAVFGGVYTNKDVTTAFYFRELALFCRAEYRDSGGAVTQSVDEVLYAYGNAASSADIMPAYDTNTVVEKQIDVMVWIGNDATVDLTLESGVYVTQTQLTAALDALNINEKAITYTEELVNSELISGEKISAAFGKIAKLIKSAISHFSNKDNPHEVTAEQAGAAKSTHTHSANQINSGTLGVARGGTGKGSWDANKLIYPSGTTTLSQLAFPTKTNQVLHQGTSGAPYWGYARASEYGTYAGNENSGADNMNSLTFNTLPSIVIISNINIPGRYGLLFPGASRGFSCVDGVYHEIKVSFDGSTIKWYYDSTDSYPDRQLNIGFNAYVGIY